MGTAHLAEPPGCVVLERRVVTAQAPVSAGLLVPDVSGGGTVYYMTPQDIGAPVEDFDEIWHLTRFGDNPAWSIAGIQQRH